MDTAESQWAGVVETLEEVLEDVLEDLHLAKAERIRADVIALQAFDTLETYLVRVKDDLGI